jgi:hypothetical protein
METPLASFHFRHNPDGSWDSICLHCFATAARASSEAELTEAQKRHNCELNFSRSLGREFPREHSIPAR